MLQPPLLILKLFQSLYITYRHSGIFGLPVVVGGDAHPVLPEKIGDRDARFILFQYAYDLFLRIPRFLPYKPPCQNVLLCRTLHTSGIFFRGDRPIMTDPYGSNFGKGDVAVRALMDVYIAVRHAESFAHAKDI